MSKKDFTLYWTSLAMYEDCPQSFLWGRGWGAIDVGGGPGKKKPEPLKQSRHHAVMGIVIAAVSERLYNDEWWRDPKTLTDRLKEAVKKEFNYQTSKPWNWIDYRMAGTKSSLIKTCEDGILGYLRTMKEHRLLGEYARAEVELLGWIDKWNPVGGRADTIIRRSDTGVTILDGKNSKSKGKYTDPDQLRWYALLYWLAYRRLPDRLGFVYYRYPYGTPMEDEKGEPVLGEDGVQMIEQGVEWVPFTKDDLRGLAQRAVKARRGMEKGKFEATPSPKTCRFCDYETVCPERQAQKDANRRTTKPDVPELAGSGGFIDL